jgi:dUTP pyrophosphatase
MKQILEVLESELLWGKDYEDVIIPSKKEEDADYDIYAYFKEDYMIIQPHETKMIPTGLRVAMNKKWKLALEERGSTGTKGMGQRAGEVDSGFRGEIKVPITNHNNKPLIILKGDSNPMIDELAIVYPYSKAICQGALVEVPNVKSKEINVEILKAIPSERGEKMLGSSGK